jgi:hypothetical protein
LFLVFHGCCLVDSGFCFKFKSRSEWSSVCPGIAGDTVWDGGEQLAGQQRGVSGAGESDVFRVEKYRRNTNGEDNAPSVKNHNQSGSKPSLHTGRMRQVAALANRDEIHAPASMEISRQQIERVPLW